MNGWLLLAWRLSLALLLFGLWEGISGPIVDKFWFSRPSDIAVWLWQSALNGQLGNDLFITFRATAIGYVYGAIAGLALGLALASDTLSIATMEVVDNLVMLVIPGAMDAGIFTALFWGSLALSLALAFFAAVPVNRWLLSQGKGHAVVHRYHQASAGHSG